MKQGEDSRAPISLTGVELDWQIECSTVSNVHRIKLRLQYINIKVHYVV